MQTINFNYELDFKLENENNYIKWIKTFISNYDYLLGEVNYIFCSDDYLLDINKQFLNHDYYTDIITFDNCLGKELNADIFISIDRVKDNAIDFSTNFDTELLRVICHGVLHLMGFKDKTALEKELMRTEEDKLINMFHVEH